MLAAQARLQKLFLEGVPDHRLVSRLMSPSATETSARPLLRCFGLRNKRLSFRWGRQKGQDFAILSEMTDEWHSFQAPSRKIGIILIEVPQIQEWPECSLPVRGRRTSASRSMKSITKCCLMVRMRFCPPGLPESLQSKKGLCG